MTYAVPAVQRILVHTARALFRGTVRDKATGGGRKGREEGEEKLLPFPQLPEYHPQLAQQTTASPPN